MTANDISALPIQYVRGVGPRRAELLGRMGIRTVADALAFLPFRYEDRGLPKKVHELVPDQPATVSGRIISAELVRLRGRGMTVFEVKVNDGTGYLRAKWFNQPFLSQQITAGQDIVLSGRPKLSASRSRGLEMEGPDYEVNAPEEGARAGFRRIVPVYRITEGISQKQFRRIMASLVEEFAGAWEDPVPREIRERNNLPQASESLRRVHLPEGEIDLELWNQGKSPYHDCLSFGELFVLETGLALMKRNAVRHEGISLRSSGRYLKELRGQLPFPLTAAQERVIAEIREDMHSSYPMNRLLQGDVGCGKTLVALAAMLDAAEAGYQAAFMAPTEILAEQQHMTISRLAGKMGIRVSLVTSGARQGSGPPASGDAQLVVGTHALIQEGVGFRSLGLVVIDEQHKFGVSQRAKLREKGVNPDVLVMTATPIPRSLALTLYGDLDCSVIDELPPGRTPVMTRLFGPEHKDEILSALKRELEAGRQAYVVYPAIGENESSELKSAIEGREAFARIFPERTVGIVHGRMPAREREAVMESFRQREISILVATTVIEVGVDVPNATIMVIVHAERFGLAQLHQLRGRVGRGGHVASCFLIAYPPLGEDARRRLEVMTASTDGFRIAEEDLVIRGPGDFLGTRQAGIPDLRIADIFRDSRLLETARREAFALVDRDPELAATPSLKRAVEVFWKGKSGFLTTG